MTAVDYPQNIFCVTGEIKVISVIFFVILQHNRLRYTNNSLRISLLDKFSLRMTPNKRLSSRGNSNIWLNLVLVSFGLASSSVILFTRYLGPLM